MDKNPISVLQEYTMLKLRKTPVYSVISEKSGTHINYFKIKVECNGEIEVGEGRSKKEARLDAALKMYNKFNGHKTDKTKQQPTSTSVPQALDQQSLNSNPSLSPTINYIGKLQEHAQIYHGSCPVYDDKNVCGPSHNPKFTIICKYGDCIEEAEGKSKKEAKNLAAKKMYDRITLITKDVDINSSSIGPLTEVKPCLNLITQGVSQVKIYENNKILLKESIEKAKKQFAQLSKTIINKNPVNDNISFEEYHTFLKNSFSFEKRSSALKILEDIFDSNLTLDATNLMRKLKLALKILNINLKESFHGFSKRYFIYNLQLETDPVIREMAQGKCADEAKMKTIEQMAETLIIMLI